MGVLTLYSTTHSESAGLPPSTQQDWRVAEVFRDFLQIFSDVMDTLSVSNYPSSSRAILLLHMMPVQLANKEGDPFLNKGVVPWKPNMSNIKRTFRLFLWHPLSWIQDSSWRGSKFSLLHTKKIWDWVWRSKWNRYWRCYELAPKYLCCICQSIEYNKFHSMNKDDTLTDLFPEICMLSTSQEVEHVMAFHYAFVFIYRWVGRHTQEHTTPNTLIELAKTTSTFWNGGRGEPPIFRFSLPCLMTCWPLEPTFNAN